MIEKYNQFFVNEVLTRLNERQKAAVDQIEGPVMVIAGPGTGKTHILAARVGNILLKTDVHAKNILCLTFTEAAVLAMRKRLLRFIGPEAHRIHIFTFHSFCNRVIQDNLELFGMQELEPLSELERIGILRGIIDQLPYRHPLRLGRSNPYFYERHLRSLFRWMKLERWSAEDIHEKTEAYLGELHLRKEFVYQVSRGNIEKGSLKQAKADAVRLKMKRLKAASDLFSLYNEALAQARRYDYEDMILWVIRAFEEHEYLLKTYQEQYQYFLIDEFQDTNGAQNEIIKKLVAYWDNPNLFIVGDDDQSIFEFQGARLKNLTDFRQKYIDGIQLYVLDHNYRSSQRILDGAHALINKNEKRIVHSLGSTSIEKLLVAKHPEFADLPFFPEVIIFKNRFQEDVAIVQAIRKLQEEGVPLEETAVIYARHRQSVNIVTLLEKYGIPYQTHRKINLLNIPLVIQFRQLLSYLASELEYPGRGDHQLYKILHFQFVGIPRSDIEKISWHLAKTMDTTMGRWGLAIADTALHKKLELESGTQIKQLSNLLREAIQRSTNYSLPYFIEWLINQSGVLKFVIGHPEKVWLIQIVKSFMDFVKTEHNKKPRLSLKGLLELLTQMDDNYLPIEAINEVKAHQGVNLLTAHSAKGLEFQRVFIIDAVKENWEPSNRAGAFQFALPDTLTYSGEEDAVEARRRLFYVAMTRAKERVTISYSEENGIGKPLERALFIDELIEGSSIVERHEVLSEEMILETQILELREQVIPSIQVLDEKWIDDLLAGLKLSTSALTQYLRCPLGFYYEYILRAPYLPSEAATYGTAIHGALYQFFANMLNHKRKAFAAKTNLLQSFEKEMSFRRGDFAFQNYKRYLEQGGQNLSNLYDRKVKEWHKKVQVEMTIKEVEVDGVPLKGTIDKIEFYEGQQAAIVDYKTGGQDKSKLSRPTKSRPYGGNYWRQLVFYKLLYENYEIAPSTVKEGKVVYIDPDDTGQNHEVVVPITKEDVDQVRTFIKDVYQKIQNHEFYQGCNKPNCKWCGFVKNNDLVAGFSNQLVEELDDK